jgi:hypothetical protein
MICQRPGATKRRRWLSSNEVGGFTGLSRAWHFSISFVPLTPLFSPWHYPYDHRSSLWCLLNIEDYSCEVERDHGYPSFLVWDLVSVVFGSFSTFMVIFLTYHWTEVSSAYRSDLLYGWDNCLFYCDQHRNTACRKMHSRHRRWRSSGPYLCHCH